MSSSVSAGRFAAVAVGAVFAVSSWSFSNVRIGDTITNVDLPTLEGGRHPLLGNERANVFFFFRPDQEHSREVLTKIAHLERELGRKSVHWVAIVSDRYDRAEVEAAVEAAELDVPVLVDVGDALVGKLGVVLHPVVGITDETHVLKAYQHFTKINFIGVLRAHLLHTLGELSEQELEDALDPPRAGQGDHTNSLAKRNLNLARMLFKVGNFEKALETVRKSLVYAPEQAEAHALLGAILAARGDCPGALDAFDRALRLDPNEPTALEGKKGCQGG
jgi:tetratricopeptide (TPR) repeat protein